MSKKSDAKSSPESLSAFSAFMLGAVSKCAATCLTYPAIRWIMNLNYLSLDFVSVLIYRFWVSTDPWFQLIVKFKRKKIKKIKFLHRPLVSADLSWEK